jgi:hypothetical protein
MAGVELSQFHIFLYSAREGVSAGYDAPSALPREQNPPLFFVMGLGGGGLQGHSGDFGKGKSFYLLPRFIARLLGFPTIIIFTVPSELSAVTHMSLFLDCRECF